LGNKVAFGTIFHYEYIIMSSDRLLYQIEKRI
jgi:hypothetical protein